MRNIINGLLLLILTAFTPFIFADNNKTFTLTVNVNDLRNSTGIVQFALYNKDDTIPDEKYEKGMQIRKSVLGEDYVKRAEANKSEFDADFQRLITEVAWGKSGTWNLSEVRNEY